MDKNKQVSPVLLKSVESTNIMRGRDVVATLQNRNLDPILVETIAKIAEVNHANSTQLVELASLVDGVIDIVQNFANISENMKKKMKALEKSANEELEGDASATNTSH